MVLVQSRTIQTDAYHPHAIHVLGELCFWFYLMVMKIILMLHQDEILQGQVSQTANQKRVRKTLLTPPDLGRCTI